MIRAFLEVLFIGIMIVLFAIVFYRLGFRRGQWEEYKKVCEDAVSEQDQKDMKEIVNRAEANDRPKV